MTGISYRGFGGSVINLPDLVNLWRDRCLYTHTSREIWSDFSIYWGSDDGCGLVHAINTTDGFSLDDRCVWYYRLRYKSRSYSFGRVTFARIQEPRVIECIDQFPCAELIPLQSAVISRDCIHCTSSVLHRVGYVRGGTFRRHVETFRPWWPYVRYDDTAQGCEIRNIIGKTISKDEESSTRCRRCHKNIC